MSPRSGVPLAGGLAGIATGAAVVWLYRRRAQRAAHVVEAPPAAPTHIELPDDRPLPAEMADAIGVGIAATSTVRVRV